MAQTLKCPYCGAGWQGRQISVSHLKSCDKKFGGGNAQQNAAGVSSALSSLGLSTDPREGYETMFEALNSSSQSPHTGRTTTGDPEWTDWSTEGNLGDAYALNNPHSDLDGFIAVEKDEEGKGWVGTVYEFEDDAGDYTEEIDQSPVFPTLEEAKNWAETWTP